jgi:hypothetical protein
VFVRHLHVRREHGVGRRQYRRQQHRRAKRQTGGERGQRSKARDGEHHANRGQEQRRAPPPVRDRQPQLQARCEQRDEHGHLRQQHECGSVR